MARGRFRWSDLGSWDSLEPHLDAAAGNRVRGRAPVVNIGASGNVVWNQTGRALALVGVEDLIVVETEDVLLIWGWSGAGSLAAAGYGLPGADETFDDPA